MKLKIKEALFDLSPTFLGGLMAIRSRRVAQRTEQREGLDELSEHLVEHHGRSVKAGPFKGLILPDAMRKRHIGPFLLGSYESCLHTTIETISGNTYDSVVDVGSSFGYYAVGLARLFPEIPVYAFDTDPWARRQVRNGARENECSNVHARVACTPSTLEEIVSGSSLVFSDCEGYEAKLFNPKTVDHLKDSDVIIEIHPAGSKEVAETIRGRFQPTHRTSVVSMENKNKRKQFIPEGVSEEAIKEWRSPSQEWLICLNK